MITHYTKSGKETAALGRRFAKTLHGGEVVAFFGDLGAGKTTFIQGVIRGLGIKKVVTSPTFILMNVFLIKNKKSKIQNVVHIDCYRARSSNDIVGIGVLEYFNDPRSVVLIEWPEKITNILPKRRIDIKIDFRKNDARELKICDKTNTATRKKSAKKPHA